MNNPDGSPFTGEAPQAALGGFLAVAMNRAANEVLQACGLTSGAPRPEVREPILFAAQQIAAWAIQRDQTSSTPPTSSSDV